MTIFNIAKYPQAKFRDVEFHYQDSSVQGGRKTVTHEFPDTNTRYVEDLGKLEKTFNINALIDITSNNKELDSFVNALEKEGVASLTHPVYKKQNVVVKSYNINDSIRELGIVKINILFEKASKNKFPEQQESKTGKLTNLKTSLASSLNEKFGDSFKSVKGNIEKFRNGVKAIKATSREIKRVTSLITGAADEFNDAVTSLNELVNDAGALVQAPSELAAKLGASFNNIGFAFENASDLFNVTKLLTPFFLASEDSPVGSSSTSLDIKSNQALINDYVSSTALSIAYEQSTLINITDLDQLNQIKESLESSFNSLSDTLDRDIYNILLEMRAEANSYLNSLLLSLPRVVEIETQETSLSSLVYSIYGDLENKETIKDLNKIRDTSRVSGTIKILSYGQ